MIQSPKRELFSRRVVASPFPVVVCFAHSKCSSVFTLFSSQDTKIFERYRVVTDDQSKSELLSVLKLRYFTPREVANLHGFPSDFCECYLFYWCMWVFAKSSCNAAFFFSINKRWKSDFHLTNEFLFSVPLFSNRSEMTSSCGKNKWEAMAKCVTVVLNSFSCLLWSVNARQYGIYLFQ